MTGKLLAGLSCAALTLASSGAAATRMLVAPMPGEANGGLPAVVARAVESAALNHLPDVEVVTPGALEQKLELDLARSCAGEGDDAACVVEFASALGVDYVLRQRLSQVGGATHLTLSLYDGARPQLLAQGSRSAASDDADHLLDQIPALLVEVAKKARLPVDDAQAGLPVLGLALVGGGAVGLALGALGAGASALVDAQYFDAKLYRDSSRTWEGARLVSYGVAGASLVGGAALVAAGALTWE